MRKRSKKAVMASELGIAISLVWGFLRADQYEQAYQLARGALRVWPDDERLLLMAAYAAVELLEPLDKDMLAVLDRSACREWANLVARRAALQAAYEAGASTLH